MNKKGELNISDNTKSSLYKITLGCVFGHNYVYVTDLGIFLCTRCGKTR